MRSEIINPNKDSSHNFNKLAWAYEALFIILHRQPPSSSFATITKLKQEHPHSYNICALTGTWHEKRHAFVTLLCQYGILSAGDELQLKTF